MDLRLQASRFRCRFRFRFTQEHDPNLHKAVDRIEPSRMFQIIKLSLSADPHRSSTSMEYF